MNLNQKQRLLVQELQFPGNTDKPKAHISRAAGSVELLRGSVGWFSVFSNLVLMEKYKFGNSFSERVNNTPKYKYTLGL